MTQEQKDQLYRSASHHVHSTQEAIGLSLSEAESSRLAIAEQLNRLSPMDRIVQVRVVKNLATKIEDLQLLLPSPYFIQVKVRFDDEQADRLLYFARFSFPEQQIFSWVSPASVIRFESPGRFSYLSNDGLVRSGKLLSKDQFLIADGKILFMATESGKEGRQLIYQEYFSQKKIAFQLPEIVEKMEKAQDAVIRADFRGSFLVAGPAGSGKTTLALHRLAYLVQSPDASAYFPSESLLVLVQDNNTRNYFASLLPNLGVENVTVTTFALWALGQLNLPDVALMSYVDAPHHVLDRFYYEKYQALQSLSSTISYADAVFDLLTSIYKPYLSANSEHIFKDQLKNRVLDRLDLTLLLILYVKRFGGLLEKTTQVIAGKNGKVERLTTQKNRRYSLVVVDEVQNYLPEQLRLLQGCIDQATDALLYVGDVVQKTQLFALEDWQSIGQTFAADRFVKLEKVYRLTEQILQYMQHVGFSVTIPEGLRQGPVVEERQLSDHAAVINQLRTLVTAKSDDFIGIISFNDDLLRTVKEVFSDQPRIRCMTSLESQGVEFDVVCVIGISDELIPDQDKYTDITEVYNQRKRINKDLLYVALTRAMRELYVFGSSRLQDVIAQLS